MELDLLLRFDYGHVVPWVTSVERGIRAIAGPDAVLVTSDVPLQGRDLRMSRCSTEAKAEHCEKGCKTAGTKKAGHSGNRRSERELYSQPGANASVCDHADHASGSGSVLAGGLNLLPGRTDTSKGRAS